MTIQFLGGSVGGAVQKFYCHLAALVSMCRRTTIIYFTSFCAGPSFHGTQDDNKIWGGGSMRGVSGGGASVRGGSGALFRVSCVLGVADFFGGFLVHCGSERGFGQVAVGMCVG